MIAELPFVTADEIAEQYRPGGRTSTKSVLATLRKHDLMSDGIVRHLRDRSGHAQGTLKLYSALTRDAVALAAAGNERAGRGLIAKANKLEGRADARVLADGLAAIAGPLAPDHRTIAELFAGLTSAQPMMPQLTKYIQAVEKARPREGVPWQVALGRVSTFDDALAAVDLLDLRIIQIPTVQMPAIGFDALRIGLPISIRWTVLGKGTWMATEPAIEIPTSPEYPFARQNADPIVVPEAVLNGAPSIRRSGRIQIAD